MMNVVIHRYVAKKLFQISLNSVRNIEKQNIIDQLNNFR